MPETSGQPPAAARVGGSVREACWASLRLQGRLAGAFGPVIEPLGEPATGSTTAGRFASVGDERLEGGLRRGGHGRHVRAIRPAGADDRLADPDAHATPEPQPAGAVDGDRNEGNVRSKREVGGPVVERQHGRLDRPDPPLPRDRDDGAAGDHGADLAGRLEQVVLAGLVRESSSRSSSSAGSAHRRPCPLPWARRTRGGVAWEASPSARRDRPTTGG